MPAFPFVVEVIEHFNSITGVIMNLLLLYAIKRFSNSNLGTYKHLVTIFTVLDMYLIFLHIAVHPRVLRVGNIHSVASEGIIDDRRITSFWVGCQSLPFTLLGIHFLYRYWSVCRPNLIVIFKNKTFVAFLSMLTLGGLFAWYFLCLLSSSGHDHTIALKTMADEYEKIYGKRVENAWILFDQWRDDTIDVMLITVTAFANVMMACSLIFSAVLAFLTFQNIRTTFKLAAKTSQLQRKLLIMLCGQAAVPTIFVYMPFVFCINSVFLKIGGTIFHDIAAPLLTFFPLLDPAIILLLYTDYRRGLMGMVRKPADIGPTTMQMTTMFVLPKLDK